MKNPGHIGARRQEMSNFLIDYIDSCTIFNQPCLLCGAGDARRGLCRRCRDALPRLPPSRCRHCALPLPSGRVCGRCLRHPPAFDALHVSHVFCHPVAGLIHAFKYGKRLQLAGVLGALLAESTPPVGPEFGVITAVPLAKERLAERGFNQSVELARALTGILGVRFFPTLCVRKRNTLSQAGLDVAGRRRNLRDAFDAKTSLDGVSVAIVDDVVTTGSTLDMLAKTLKNRGAKRVEAWALARTLDPNT